MRPQNGARGMAPIDGHPSGDREPVRVRLLGGFGVSVGARTIGEDEWRLKKAGDLVKLLALAPDHRMHRERTMYLLWPELGPKAAANNLRQALHAARRVLDPVASTAASSRYLRLEGERLALCPDGPSVGGRGGLRGGRGRGSPLPRPRGLPGGAQPVRRRPPTGRSLRGLGGGPTHGA